MTYKVHPPEDRSFVRNIEDKTAGLCLFYNLALDRMNELISIYEKKEDIFLEKKDFSQLQQPLFTNDTYLQLKVYLWKEPVSNSYAQVLSNDIRLINMFLHKLVDVRNFQSHYFHEAEALRFPQELVYFITNMFEKAKNQLHAKQENFDVYLKQLENDVTTFKKEIDGKTVEKKDTYKHFDFFSPDGLIKEEGKNFFLSFFLLRGEMNKFLKKRKRCKKDNGEKYQVKTKLYTYYCHRDGSNRFFLDAKEAYMSPKELLRRQYNTVLNYLKTQPVAHYKYLPPPKDMPLYSREEIAERKEEKLNGSIAKTEDHEIIRRKDKFLDIAVHYFMDRNSILETNDETIFWHTENLLPEETKKQNALISANEFKTYFKKTPHWHNVYQPGFFPVYVHKHIKFKLSAGDATEYAIGEREIKNWLYYLLSNTERKTMAQTIEAIQKYGIEYQAAFNELVETNAICFEKYPLVFEKGVDSVILSEMHKKIIEGRKFSQEEYRDKIAKSLNSQTNLLTHHAAQKEDYTRNKKNRIILDCFNWFLPVEAKLKPDEVNKLSIFNFVAESHLNTVARNSIIKDFEHKLQKAQHGAFAQLQSASSLNNLFDAMIDHKLKSLSIELKGLPAKNETQLNELASKLGISLPGITLSRTEGKSRVAELKQTISTKPVLITNGLFSRAFAEASKKATISAKILKNKQWTSLLMPGQYSLLKQDDYINGGEEALKDIPKHVLQVVDNNYDIFFKEYATGEGQKFKTLVNKFMALLPNGSVTTDKQAADAINLYRGLRETQAHDALLAQILFQYHNSAVAGLKKGEITYTNITELYEAKYQLKIGQVTITLDYKQLDDLATKWDRKKIENLFKNNKYWNKDLLDKLNEKGAIKSDQQKILILMDKVWEDSYHYIDAFFKVEAKKIKRANSEKIRILLAQSKIEQQKRNNLIQGFQRIEPKVVLEEYNNITTAQTGNFVKLRNDAFHTNIPGNNAKYETEKDALLRFAEIEIKAKPDKNRYKK